VEKIVGVSEMSKMLGLTKVRVWQLAQHPDFPAPCYEMDAGKFWRLVDFLAWTKRTGRKVKR